MSLTEEEKDAIIDLLTSRRFFIRDPIILVDQMSWSDGGERRVHVMDHVLFSGIYLDRGGQWDIIDGDFTHAVFRLRENLGEVETRIHFDELVGRVRTTQECERPKDAMIVYRHNDNDFIEQCVQAIQLGRL